MSYGWTKHNDEWAVRAWEEPEGMTGNSVLVRSKAGREKVVKLGKCVRVDGKSQTYLIVDDRPKNADPVTEPGVYESADGIFVVKYTRDKQRLYAKKLIEINADRLNSKDELVQIEFEYVKGAISKLQSSQRMPLDRAKALTIRYGRCINCGRTLKAAKSVEQGIGPVCIKSFGPIHKEVAA